MSDLVGNPEDRFSRVAAQNVAQQESIPLLVFSYLGPQNGENEENSK